MAARGGDAKAGTEGLVTGGRPVRTAASCRGLGSREGLEGGARRRGQSPRLETRDVVSGACRGRWTGEADRWWGHPEDLQHQSEGARPGGVQRKPRGDGRPTGAAGHWPFEERHQTARRPPLTLVRGGQAACLAPSPLAESSPAELALGNWPRAPPPGRGAERGQYLLPGEEQHPEHGEDGQVQRQQQHDTGRVGTGLSTRRAPGPGCPGGSRQRPGAVPTPRSPTPRGLPRTRPRGLPCWSARSGRDDPQPRGVSRGPTDPTDCPRGSPLPSAWAGREG